MRIIAGHARGRPLKAPPGRNTRPTPDRVREALFSRLGAFVADAIVLDLFAGTGALGLEARSRGAMKVILVEEARVALVALRHNVAVVGLSNISVLALPAHLALRKLAQGNERFDLVFLDPPYQSSHLETALASLVDLDLLRPNALIVCEHHAKYELLPPPAYALCHCHRYGDVALSTLTRRPKSPTSTR